MNLGKTQAEWTRLLGRELAYLFLAPLREAREAYDTFTLERVQFWNIGDRASATPQITALTIAGLDPGVNCTTELRLYFRWVANGGNWDVNIYKATGGGGGDLVAHVTNIAASGTAALVADNSSGLTGSITIGATIAADATDRHQVLAKIDYPLRLAKVLTQDGTVEDDQHSRVVLQDLYAQLAAFELQKIGAIRAAISRWALTDGRRNPIARGRDFTSTSDSALSSDVDVPDLSGNVARKRTGWFYTVADAMEDEATGGEQDVVRRVPSAGAGSADAGNTGLFTIASHTPREKAIAGRWVFKVSDDTIGKETFTYEFTSDEGDITLSGSGPQIKKEWSGPNGFGPITMLRTLTKTNDGSNLHLAATSACTVTGETSENTNDGKVYWKVVANGSNKDYEFYKASTYHSSKLVAKATNIATGADFTATAQNASGLEIAWTAGSAPVATTTGELNLNVPKVENANGVPDQITVTVTVAASPGLIQTIFAEELDAQLNSDTSGSESIPDNYAKAGTFHPFLLQRN